VQQWRWVLPQNGSGTQRGVFARDHCDFLKMKNFRLWQPQDRGGLAAGRRVLMSAVRLVFAVERAVEAPVVLFAS
jgi:hypothetical protein